MPTYRFERSWLYYAEIAAPSLEAAEAQLEAQDETLPLWQPGGPCDDFELVGVDGAEIDHTFDDALYRHMGARRAGEEVPPLSSAWPPVAAWRRSDNRVWIVIQLAPAAVAAPAPSQPGADAAVAVDERYRLMRYAYDPVRGWIGTELDRDPNRRWTLQQAAADAVAQCEVDGASEPVQLVLPFGVVHGPYRIVAQS